MPDSDDFTPAVVPTQSNAQAMLRNFITAVLGPAVDVVAAQQNRVPEPKSPDFVVMTPIRYTRLATNLDQYQDARFFGSILGTTLTISSLSFGTVGIGSQVFGVGVIGGTTITGLGPGPGRWLVTPIQQVANELMAAGRQTYMQSGELVVQLDFHSASTSDAGDMARTVSTLFRDEFATTQFANQVPSYDVTPLHADDAKQMPFINENQQFEWRWVVEARVQCNDVIVLPQQYAESLHVNLISVQAAYGP
jgi:hypothetical protein